ncbi:hypothetical protein C0995_016729 [Termitomyces sp. Mi166|nr:hypothetical protein C0995_016729 [Termitomyces sp. Mi166\
MTAPIPAQKSALNIVMARSHPCQRFTSQANTNPHTQGAMTFGAAGTNGARVHLKDVEAILDVFRAHGHTEIDTATVYAAGTSEEYLGKIDWKGKGLKIETKLYPSPRGPGGEPISHTPESLRKWLLRSLKALNAEYVGSLLTITQKFTDQHVNPRSSIEMWYLHGPDRSVPYEVTLKAVNDLYKEGLFKRFGISNYMAWEVAEIVAICKANGYIQPTVYQGIYNAIHRNVEPELFPCLRKYGIAFYEYNPLGGGFFTGRYTSSDGTAEMGSRFDPDAMQGKMYRQRYWKEPYFEALTVIRKAAEAHNLTLPEVALRWISHHSLLSREHGDAVLIGASSLKHIEQNLIDLEKGPLPEDVVKALDEAWAIAKPISTVYYH